MSSPRSMKAVVIDRFGGADRLSVQERPVPRPGPDEILIHVEAAGVGVWDPLERQGEMVGLMDHEPSFPYVLGSEGAGTVAAVGEKARTRFQEGDRVYGVGFLNPKGGFYAEYAVVKADDASGIPGALTTEQAAAMGVDAMTALRGLDTLGVQEGESLAIFGASGGVGHLAVQLARRLGARVLAIASGDDGVLLCKQLGADAVVDGKTADVAAACRQFAADGLDAALVTASGRGLDAVLEAVKDGGRVAHPNGVSRVPAVRSGVRLASYDGLPDRQAIARLERLILSAPFEVHVARTFPLARAAEAHGALAEHHLGKLALKV